MGVRARAHPRDNESFGILEEGREAPRALRGAVRVLLVYKAASASAWLGNSPAYFVMPTIVNTFVK